MIPLRILLLNAIALAVFANGLMQSAISPGRGSGAAASGSSNGGGGTASDTGNGCGTSTSGVPTVSCTVNGVSAGQAIVVNFTAYSNNLGGLADSNSGTVAMLPGYPVAFSGGGYDYMFVISNTGAGAHTLTVTSNGGGFTYPTIIADLVNGASISAPIDASNNFMGTAPSGNNVTFACGNITTTKPGELLISFVNLVGPTPALTPGTSPQQMTISQAPVPNGESEYGIAATPGINHVEWGLPSGGNSFVCDTVAVH